MTNRLQFETSPYLLQHATNPVDWHPWGEEALLLSKQLNKPIILSVGYSACHWCHVMAHECFENPEIAALMNKDFINIKLDREERPDLDQIYQNVAQVFTHGGGWPLTVFLTPELKPFFGGTYFPPEDRHGRAGFRRVLNSLSEAFQTKRSEIEENALEIMKVIDDQETLKPSESSKDILINQSSIQKLLDDLLKYADYTNGGFGGAPKFPGTMMLGLMWRIVRLLSTQSPLDSKSLEPCKQARSFILMSLRKMASGGIFDQLGGGFHRYSVDETWSVPHFEKMLYDQGLLLKIYAEVLLSDDNLTQADRTLFLRVLEMTTSYLFREMKSKNGLYYAAQDADSEGEEGKYFSWTLNQIKAVLGDNPVALEMASFFGVTQYGNFEHGSTVLSLVEGKVPEAIFFNDSVERLLGARNERIKPGLDNKSLISSNGLLISGLVFSGLAFQKSGKNGLSANCYKEAESIMEAAVRLASKGEAQPGRLFSVVSSDQKSRFNAYLDDYAFLAMAALDLCRIPRDTVSPNASSSYLQLASTWGQVIIDQFSGERGFYFTSADHEALIKRPQSLYDQAIPSGAGVSLQVLMVLKNLGATLSVVPLDICNELLPLVSRNPYGHGEQLWASLFCSLEPILVKASDHESVEPKILGDPFVFIEANDNTQIKQVSSINLGGQICFLKKCVSVKDAHDLSNQYAYALLEIANVLKEF